VGDTNEMVESLFDAFNRRDVEAVVELCDEDVEFHAATAEFAGKPDPYVGRVGMREYFDDVSRLWEELLITPREIVPVEGGVVVFGRVFARGRAHGIRDLPIAWRWKLREGRFAWGRVYMDPGQVFSDE
jgi:ketosteroid isomerase-like protein